MYGTQNQNADKELYIHGMLMDARTKKKSKIIIIRDKTEPYNTANLIRLTPTEPTDRYSACEYIYMFLNGFGRIT